MGQFAVFIGEDIKSRLKREVFGPGMKCVGTIPAPL